MSRGKRFESARRLSFLPAKSVKTESTRCSYWRLCRQYVSSRLSEASSLASVCPMLWSSAKLPKDGRLARDSRRRHGKSGRVPFVAVRGGLAHPRPHRRRDSASPEHRLECYRAHAGRRALGGVGEGARRWPVLRECLGRYCRPAAAATRDRPDFVGDGHGADRCASICCPRGNKRGRGPLPRRGVLRSRGRAQGSLLATGAAPLAVGGPYELASFPGHGEMAALLPCPLLPTWRVLGGWAIPKVRNGRSPTEPRSSVDLLYPYMPFAGTSAPAQGRSTLSSAPCALLAGGFTPASPPPPRPAPSAKRLLLGLTLAVG
jgi:hypothetical protein